MYTYIHCDCVSVCVYFNVMSESIASLLLMILRSQTSRNGVEGLLNQENNNNK